MAKKEKSTENNNTSKTGFKLDEKLIQIGNLFSQLGSVDRNSGESFVLIKDNEIKTIGGGILAWYKFDSIGLNDSFVPIDAKMFFSRDSGNYEVKNNKYSIDVIGNKRKSTIPLATFEEWASVEDRNDNSSFSIPNNDFINNFITYTSENVICKFILGKNEIDIIKKYQGYFGHKSQQEYFEIFKKNDGIIIKVKDDQKNVKAEEIEIQEGITTNNIKSNNAIKVMFSPKYLIGDDNWEVTVFTNSVGSGKKILFNSVHEKITFFAAVEDNDNEILNDEMSEELAKMDDDFVNEESLDSEFGEDDSFEFSEDE